MGSGSATASSEGARRVPPLHLVTDDAVLAAPAFRIRAERALRAGRAAVALHLRGPGTGGGALHGLAAALAPVARDVGALLLVNDRVDVALAAAADGVQLGARGLPLADARRLLGPGRLLGASVHSEEEGARAVAEGADLLLAGTIHPSASHPGRPGTGTGWLAGLAALGAPVVGIGGITPQRAAGVLAAGASGVAVLRGVWDADDPAAAVAGYLLAMGESTHA